MTRSTYGRMAFARIRHHYSPLYVIIIRPIRNHARKDRAKDVLPLSMSDNVLSLTLYRGVHIDTPIRMSGICFNYKKILDKTSSISILGQEYMKKFILLIISATFLSSGTPIQEETVSLSVNPNVVNLSELPETVEVTMTNNMQKTISAGLHYWIERYENNEWIKVSPEQAFEDIGYNFSPSVFYTYEKSLFTEEIDYKVGKYRIAKYYLKSNYQETKEAFRVYAEFEVVFPTDRNL